MPAVAASQAGVSVRNQLVRSGSLLGSRLFAPVVRTSFSSPRALSSSFSTSATLRQSETSSSAKLESTQQPLPSRMPPRVRATGDREPSGRGRGLLWLLLVPTAAVFLGPGIANMIDGREWMPQIRAQQLRHTDAEAWRRGGKPAPPLPRAVSIKPVERETMLRQMSEAQYPALITAIEEMKGVRTLCASYAASPIQRAKLNGQLMPIAEKTVKQCIQMHDWARLLIDCPSGWTSSDRVRLQVARELLGISARTLQGLLDCKGHTIVGAAIVPITLLHSSLIPARATLAHSLALLGLQKEGERACAEWKALLPADAAHDIADVHAALAHLALWRGDWSRYVSEQIARSEAFPRNDASRAAMHHVVLPICARSQVAMSQWHPLASVKALKIAQNALSYLLSVRGSIYGVYFAQDLALEANELHQRPLSDLLTSDKLSRLETSATLTDPDSTLAHLLRRTPLWTRLQNDMISVHMTGAAVLQQLSELLQVTGQQKQAQLVADCAEQLGDRVARVVAQEQAQCKLLASAQ